jgi:hypothetical protein
MQWNDPDYHKEDTQGWGYVVTVFVFILLILSWYGIYRLIDAIF